MAHFVSTSGESVRCYDGTFCSAISSAELTDERLIEKARRNPDFTEVDGEVKAKRQSKKAKKAAVKKVAKKVTKKAKK